MIAEEQKSTILVVDDHAMVRLGLEQIIARQPDMVFHGSCDNGAAAVAAVAESSPDIVLLDYRLPDLDAIEVTELLYRQNPGLKILIFSAFEGEESVWEAYNAGVSGYISKNEGAGTTLEAIRVLAAGGQFFPAEVQRKIEAREARNALTPREKEVLGLLAAGMSNKEIASRISVSATTVRHHVSNVLAKLEVIDRTQAVIAAIRRGIVQLD